MWRPRAVPLAQFKFLTQHIQLEKALPEVASGIAHVGQLVVDDEVDVGDVEAARRDVGGHQHQRLALPEAFEHPLPAALRDVAVQRLQRGGRGVKGKAGVCALLQGALAKMRRRISASCSKALQCGL